MKTRFLVLFVLAGGLLFAETRIFVGIGGGGYGYGYYPAPPPPVVYAPPCPGPGYYWVPGYWYRVGPRSLWRAGYWAPPAYIGVYRSGPRHYHRHGKAYRRW